MSDRIAMTANTVFHNLRVQNAKVGLVAAGDTFETDLAHAQDLERLGHAIPLAGSVLGIAPAPLDPTTKSPRPPCTPTGRAAARPNSRPIRPDRSARCPSPW
ncbi:hypothetical protein [Methylobacterium sp. A52T]